MAMCGDILRIHLRAFEVNQQIVNKRLLIPKNQPKSKYSISTHFNE